jgi:hypothetical protein
VRLHRVGERLDRLRQIAELCLVAGQSCPPMVRVATRPDSKKRTPGGASRSRPALDEHRDGLELVTYVRN